MAHNALHFDATLQLRKSQVDFKGSGAVDKKLGHWNFGLPFRITDRGEVWPATFISHYIHTFLSYLGSYSLAV